jgi:glyoxylase-like metal-dependent hydrolase (beta-lactamase superfamily II)
MTELHRIDRRLFLSEIGSRTFAVAVLGSGVLASCSSDGEITVNSSTGTSASTTAAAPASTTSGADATTDPVEATTTESASEGQPTDPLRWERVALGSVSAYILIRGTEVAIVDTGNPGSTPDIERALSTLDADWADVKNVILTHLHNDHIGSLPKILDLAPTATAFAGRLDAENISTASVEPLDDGDEIFGLQVIATPGHTSGHISVLDPTAGVLVAGDAMNERDGLVLGPNPNFSSNMTNANASVQRLAERQFETVVFGHGEPIETGASDAVIALAQTLG